MKKSEMDIAHPKISSRINAERKISRNSSMSLFQRRSSMVCQRHFSSFSKNEKLKVVSSMMKSSQPFLQETISSSWMMCSRVWRSSESSSSTLSIQKRCSRTQERKKMKSTSQKYRMTRSVCISMRSVDSHSSMLKKKYVLGISSRSEIKKLANVSPRRISVSSYPSRRNIWGEDLDYWTWFKSETWDSFERSINSIQIEDSNSRPTRHGGSVRV